MTVVNSDLKVVRGNVKPGHCPVCASEHPEELPHNLKSLYYQYTFMEDNGRWPTWDDAMEHCTEEVKVAWKQALDEVLKTMGGRQ